MDNVWFRTSAAAAGFARLTGQMARAHHLRHRSTTTSKDRIAYRNILDLIRQYNPDWQLPDGPPQAPRIYPADELWAEARPAGRLRLKGAAYASVPARLINGGAVSPLAEEVLDLFRF